MRTVKTVALFSGPVQVDAQGQARIPLELPDFNGELRVMAVAWDQNRLGHADTPLLVRDPLVIQAYLPRFLAPEDLSQLSLNVQNLSAAPGDYHIRLGASGTVALDGETDFVFAVTDTANQSTERLNYPLRGLEPGVGRIALQVSGPDFSLQRNWEITVRPTQAIVTERRASRLPPGETLAVNSALLQNYLPDTGRVQLSFATRPNLDVPGLLAQLDRYPYGCVEQTTSRALPLLYFNQVAQNWGSDGQADLRDRVQQAVQRILAMQRYEGGFGLWNADSPAEQWLSAYAMDFLNRAKQERYLVPESAYRQGLNWLKEGLADTDTSKQALVSKVYALYVLARAEQATLGDLRYLHDNNLHDIPTVLGRAQLGTALARYGEMGRAREAFEGRFRRCTNP
ncbi:MAG: alpha-2-macroglobulin family protein [Candidatus Competibacteraceae bacterium]